MIFSSAAACGGAPGDLFTSDPASTPEGNDPSPTAPEDPGPRPAESDAGSSVDARAQDARGEDAASDASGDAAQDASHDSGGSDAGADSSVPDGGASDAGADASADAGGDSGSDAGVCVDPGDAPGSEALAATLPALDDCDNGVWQTKNGVAAGLTDVDYYTFAGSDRFGCVVDPAVSSTTANLEICQFVSCAAGTTTPLGCNGGTLAQSPSGKWGCCVTTPGSAQPLFDCSGSDDAATVTMSVRNLVDACTPYTIGYHF